MYMVRLYRNGARMKEIPVSDIVIKQSPLFIQVNVEGVDNSLITDDDSSPKESPSPPP